MIESREPYFIPDETLHWLTLKALGQLDAQQAESLNRWLKENPEAYDDCLFYVEKVKKINWTYQSKSINDPHQFVENYLHRKTSGRLGFGRPYTFLAYAASFLILAGLVWYFLYDTEKSVPEIVHEQPPVLERQNRAILVLSDGTNLDLGSAQNDGLTNESGVHITNQPGELLRYEKGNSASEDIRTNRLIIPVGARYQLQLSDGTLVWMNSGSELEYPAVFAANNRIVRLKGEAFFDVAKDELAPFKIEVNGYEIVVLGTSLNISAYDSDDFIQTTLVSGELQVNSRRGTVHKLLPGQMALINHNSQEVSINTVDTRLYTSWRDGILHFNKITMLELAKKLERWYDVEIVFEDEQIAALTFSGALENSRDIRFLLRLIGQAANVEFEINEKQIYVK